MPVIAVVNQKGGVGKTTVALGLAATAWSRRVDCLVIDLDPQANATTGLGVWDPPFSVDQALVEERPGAILGLRVASGWPGDRGLPPSVVPSSPALAAREPQLLTDPIGANQRLAVALQGVHHDLVVIDCPPSLGLLTVNALFAADRALIITEPGAWASDGVTQILRTVERVGQRRHRRLEVAGVAVNRMGRTRDARYWDSQLRADHGEIVLPAVRLRAALAEAAASSLPIHALGSRAGAREAAAELELLFDLVVSESTPHGAAVHDAAGPGQADHGADAVAAAAADAGAAIPQATKTDARHEVAHGV